MKEKTPAGKLDDLKPYEDPYLKKHPGGVNPITGEILTKLSKLSLEGVEAIAEQAPYSFHKYLFSFKIWPKFSIGGPAGPEPTRYGDWERKGRVSDF
ncbi:unnamed protein product [Strongylus vulgaris]|uniref:Succinate dehydrogenase assembly factor 4, mitochondrial n=1 Tax=Strongylus vulgaris TaxID=40348 RepID=A0A3P7IGG9_STRVU|nr:unnamed protein product [Strongylus vulgaris]